MFHTVLQGGLSCLHLVLLGDFSFIRSQFTWLKVVLCNGNVRRFVCFHAQSGGIFEIFVRKLIWRESRFLVI